MTRALLLALLAGCALDHTTPDGGSALDFNIGGVDFNVTSGGALTRGGALTLYLTDQEDPCSAILYVPSGRQTIFGLTVGASSGTATIVPGAGKLTVEAGDMLQAEKDAVDGTVTWSMNADGTYAIASLDVGFAGTASRLTLANLTLVGCGEL